jgi:hypothetical protein
MSKSAGKIINDYVNDMNFSLCTETPKAVLAALLVSYLVNHAGVDFDELPAKIIDEWQVLHDNGIVKQKPPSLESVQEKDARYAAYLQRQVAA